MDKILDVGEIARSNVLNCDVICVEDDYDNDRYGCISCVFSDNAGTHCCSDMFTGKFECRERIRPDKKDVHYEKYEQNK